MPNWRHFAPAVVFSVGIGLTVSAGRQQAARLERPLKLLPNEINGMTGEERPLTQSSCSSLRCLVAMPSCVSRVSFRLRSSRPALCRWPCKRSARNLLR